MGSVVDLLGRLSRADYFPDRALDLFHYLRKVGNKGHDTRVPLELPTRFEFLVNLKTAKLLAIALPSTLFARADEVIE